MKKLMNRFGTCLKYFLSLGLVAATGCSSVSKVRPIGEGFGSQTHSHLIPYEHSYVSLLRTNSSGKWITVWQAISYRFEGATARNKAIVFGGVTNTRQSEQRLVRFLYFSESTGVVDLTDSLLEKANVGKTMEVGLIFVKQTGSLIKVDMRPNVGDGNWSVEVSFDQLAQMARIVVERNKKGTFDGIDFFE